MDLTVRSNLQPLYLKGCLSPGMYLNLLLPGGVVINLDLAAYELEPGFIKAAVKTQAAGLIYCPFLGVQEGFS